MFLKIQTNFWAISWRYFFYCYIQNIKIFWLTLFLKRFPVNFFWWIIYFFPVIFIYQSLMFETLSGCDSISLKFNATVTTYWKHLLSSFFNFIVVFVFFIKSGESRYEQQHPKWVMGALRKQNLWFIGKKTTWNGHWKRCHRKSTSNRKKNKNRSQPIVAHFSLYKDKITF